MFNSFLPLPVARTEILEPRWNVSHEIAKAAFQMEITDRSLRKPESRQQKLEKCKWDSHARLFAPRLSKCIKHKLRQELKANKILKLVIFTFSLPVRRALARQRRTGDHHKCERNGTISLLGLVTVTVVVAGKKKKRKTNMLQDDMCEVRPSSSGTNSDEDAVHVDRKKQNEMGNLFKWAFNAERRNLRVWNVCALGVLFWDYAHLLDVIVWLQWERILSWLAIAECKPFNRLHKREKFNS